MCIAKITHKELPFYFHLKKIVLLQLNCRNHQKVMISASEIHKIMGTKNLQDWVNGEILRGRYIFTKEDVLGLHLSISEQAMQNSLNRLTERGIIMSPWQNFYVAIPTEYKLKGVVPPTFYIDRLMKFLGRDYYVSLLSAAAMNGASHQQPMVFQVTVNGKPIRSGVKNGTQLEFTLRQDLPLEYTKQVKTQMGYMTVSGPELTALDIVAEEKKIGGLSRAAEVLQELSETTVCLCGKSTTECGHAGGTTSNILSNNVVAG